jgi:hypothetical protein
VQIARALHELKNEMQDLLGGFKRAQKLDQVDMSPDPSHVFNLPSSHVGTGVHLKIFSFRLYLHILIGSFGQQHEVTYSQYMPEW